jgi:hypothetical protein
MKAICAAQGCERPAHARGLCTMHYQRELKIHPELTCSIEGCERRAVGRGWCSMHWQRWQRHGTPYMSKQTVLERFWSKVQEGGPDDCWPWIGTASTTGYGSFYLHAMPGAGPGTYVIAHRFMYELTYGPIPKGLDIDHICRVRKCVNPAHLRVVTRKQNCEHRSRVGRGVSGIRGVHWSTSQQKWHVSVMHYGRAFKGGWFRDLAEAEQAAIALRNRLFTHNDTDHVA